MSQMPVMGQNDLVRIVQPNTPLRLEDAVKLAFPYGGMTLSGLRREIGRGRLAYEMIAGKQFTTLADIEQMRELCRVTAKDHDFGNAPPTARKGNSRRSGALRAAASLLPGDALQKRLDLLREKKRIKR